MPCLSDSPQRCEKTVNNAEASSCAASIFIRQDSRVLFLRYEELKADLAGCAARVAKHCGFTLTPQEMGEACEKMTFEWMRSHLDAFNPKCVRGQGGEDAGHH